MALIKCPECGKMISSDATSCPECGTSIDSRAAISSRNTEEVYIDARNYKTPNTFTALGVVAVLGIVLGIILGISLLFIHPQDSFTFISAAVALVWSGICLFAVFRVADDIHYISFLSQKQGINSKTTVSYYDASIDLLSQQRDELIDLVEKQNEIIELLKKTTKEKGE